MKTTIKLNERTAFEIEYTTDIIKPCLGNLNKWRLRIIIGYQIPLLQFIQQNF